MVEQGVSMAGVLPGSEMAVRDLLSGPDGALRAALCGGTLVAPAIGLIVGRRRGWPVISVFPMFIASVALLALVAAFFRRDLVVPYLRLATTLAIPFELLFMAWILITAIGTTRNFARASSRDDFYERIHAAVRQAAGAGRFSAVLAGEISILYYGLFSWFARPAAPPGQTVVSYRRSGGYGVALPAIISVIALETTVLHVLLSGFAPRAAWIVTALSLYAILWVIADDRATLLRPILMDESRLLVKSGVRWTVSLPLSRIRAVRCAPDASAKPDDPDTKRLTLFGQPQMRIELEEPATLEGLFGFNRPVRSVGISVDDWPAFRRALEGFGVPVAGEPPTSSEDFYERLRDGLRGSLRNPSAADSLARELSLLGYAFFFWRLSPGAPAPGGHAFTIHRRSGYGAILGAFLGIAMIEMTVVHLLVRNASPTAANVLLVLSAYGIVWFFGDFHALRLRPILVDGDVLRVRVGLRREARIPLQDVEALETLPAAGEPDRRSGYVRCTAFGPPELLLRLRRPANVEQMVGRSRVVSCIGLTIDDEATFRRVVKAAGDKA